MWVIAPFETIGLHRVPCKNDCLLWTVFQFQRVVDRANEKSTLVFLIGTIAAQNANSA